jgi:hypothetical protein
MRYPTLRYGNPAELQYYAQFIPLKDLAKRLRRSERSVSNWMNGRQKVPWWVPEIIRLQKMEHDAMLYQIRMRPVMLKLGVVQTDAAVIEFPRAPARPAAPPLSSSGPQCAQSAFPAGPDLTGSTAAA